jgi:hypothetical protein
MKQLIFLTILLLASNKLTAQTLEETVGYLAYVIDENPPMENRKAEFKMYKNVENEGFVYELSRTENGKIMNSITFLIFFSDIKSIQLIEGSDKKYVLYLGLGKDERRKSSLTGFKNGLREEYIDEMYITLSDRKETAERVKKAFKHLFKLKDVRVIDLNMF